MSQKLIRKKGNLIGRKRKYPLNESYFENIDTEEKAYWLGFISADGNVSLRKYGMEVAGGVLTIGIKDKEHLIKFRKSLECANPIKKVCVILNNKKYYQYRIQINSLKLANDLISLGIVPNKSLILEPIKLSSILLERAYWRGMFDGDGSIGKYKDSNKRGYSKRYRWLLSLCGTKKIVSAFTKTLDISGRKLTKLGKIYSVQFGKKSELPKIVNWLYKDSTIFLDRKRKLAYSLISDIKKYPRYTNMEK